MRTLDDEGICVRCGVPDVFCQCPELTNTWIVRCDHPGCERGRIKSVSADDDVKFRIMGWTSTWQHHFCPEHPA